jgi:hypothetical protein
MGSFFFIMSYLIDYKWVKPLGFVWLRLPRLPSVQALPRVLHLPGCGRRLPRIPPVVISLGRFYWEAEEAGARPGFPICNRGVFQIC